MAGFNKILNGRLLIKLIFILTLILLSGNGSLEAATSPDAIAFRVMPNPGHLSPLRWYQENIKLKGAPQGLTVDGYDAVRDGRTVYVNAANIDVVKNSFYTNIYIISYNQQAESATVDIFGQILAHWKFNTNIIDQKVKAAVVRDTNRLSDLSDIELVLDNYQEAHNGDYPALTAGSYITGKSISTWPSWRATLSKDLAITLPLDPVNKLGDCLSPPGYDPTTCWNQTTKKFAGTVNADNSLTLPDNSRAYIYSYQGNKTYKLCAIIETSYANLSAYSCYAISCVPTCTATANQFCRASALANSQSGTGVCCNGQLCYKCQAPYVWDGITSTCGCAPTTCAAQSKNCGTIPNGCGGTLTCGSCTLSQQTCGGGGIANVCGCTKTSCAAQGKNCGTIPDGCGGTLNCGSCTLPVTCGGSGIANVCGCTPTTCAAQGKNCGTISDTCGGNLSCGNCTFPQICGGANIANVCGCTPSNLACGANNCGSASDGCGGTISCGSCVSPNTCLITSRTSGICTCAPNTKVQSCGTSNCGSASDGCGGTIICGTGTGICVSPLTCSGASGGPGACIGCGDGIEQSNEVCDKGPTSTTRTQSCSTNSVDANCIVSSVAGSQTCNSTCNGWSDCSSPLSSFPASTYSYFFASGQWAGMVVSDNACCWLTKCVKDDISGYCGQDLVAGYASYTSHQEMVCSGPLAQTDSPPPFACRMSQGINNHRDWYVSVDHATVHYACFLNW